MDIQDLSCSICLDICEDAMEATCCGILFCQRCVPNMKDCPVCRAYPLNVSVSRSMRKMIGKLEVACSLCSAQVQRSNLADHKKVCPMRDFICGVPGCRFTGVKEKFWTHLREAHESQVLDYMTGSAAMQPVGACAPDTSLTVER